MGVAVRVMESHVPYGWAIANEYARGEYCLSISRYTSKADSLKEEMKRKSRFSRPRFYRRP